MSGSMAIRLGFQGAVTAAFAVLAYFVVDVGALLDALRAVDLRWALVALPLFTLAKFVDSVRWRYLLRGVGSPPQAALFAAFLVGNMVNNLLPLRAGDVAKIQVLANRYGLSRAGLAGSVFIVEAALDGVVFVGFLGVGLLLLDLEAIPGLTRWFALGIAGAATVGVTAAVLVRHRASWLPIPERFAEHLARLQDGLGALDSLPRGLGAVALSVPAWLLEASMFATMRQAFGLDLAFPTYLTAMVAANVAVAVPFGLWNLGPYEVLVSAVLVAAGVSADVALSYALGVHLLTNAWINATGLVAFLALGVSPREVFALSRGEREPAPEGTRSRTEDEASDYRP